MARRCLFSSSAGPAGLSGLLDGPLALLAVLVCLLALLACLLALLAGLAGWLAGLLAGLPACFACGLANM